MLASTLPPYRLILVDDDSAAAETRDLLAAFARAHGATLIRNETAGGHTRAANAGLAAAGAPWVVLLNSDTVVAPGWLDRLVAHGRRDPRLGLVGPVSNAASWQSVPELPEAADRAENPLPPGLDVAGMARLVAGASAGAGVPLPVLDGFCLLLRREMLAAIGPFDEARSGAGCGEVNDLCTRARRAGWGLLVADDVYVHRARPRNCPQERRRAPAERADRAPIGKHDPRPHIRPQVEVCRDSLALAGARARVRAAIVRRRLVQEGRARWEGRRIAIVLPAASEGAAVNLVLQEARAMRRMGVDAWLVNLAGFRRGFEAACPGLDLPVLYAADEGGVAGLLTGAPGFDAVVAALCRSVPWLPEGAGAPPAACYVQDFEPLFLPPGDPGHAPALRSCTARADLRLLTRSRRDAAEVERATGGRRAVVVGASADIDLFRPAPGKLPRGPGEPVRVCATLRPATPRRAPVLTTEVLRGLAGAPGVEIEVFGAEEAEIAAAGLAVPGALNRGRLRCEQLAWMLARADVFLDLSSHQAMGLTALEAMACGCAVLVPARGGAAELVANGTSGLVVATADPAACHAAARRLVQDHALRARLQAEAAAAAPAHHPEAAAARLLEALFGDGEASPPPAPARAA